MYDYSARLMEAFRSRYPAFRCMRMVFAGEPGSGKSCVLASVPVPQDKIRLAMDSEDSMAYLDAGKDGVDIYTPRRQQFRMNREVMPDIPTYGKFIAGIRKEPGKVGALVIDNAAVLQDQIVLYLTHNAVNPKTIQDMYAMFEAQTSLPNAGIIKTWAYNHNGDFWTAAKGIPKAILLLCLKQGIHFLASTEEGNVWQDYGGRDQKLIGKKAKLWDVWYRYTDAVISLKREVNTTNPPWGQLYATMPKMRLQGMNPRFKMDWEGFITELEAAATRSEAEIPEDAKAEIPKETTTEFGGKVDGEGSV